MRTDGWATAYHKIRTPVYAFPFKLHTSELADGYEWGRLNLQSVTEESDLNEFLSTAKLAGTEFAAGGEWRLCKHETD